MAARNRASSWLPTRLRFPAHRAAVHDQAAEEAIRMQIQDQGQRGSGLRHHLAQVLSSRSEGDPVFDQKALVDRSVAPYPRQLRFVRRGWKSHAHRPQITERRRTSPARASKPASKPLPMAGGFQVVDFLSFGGTCARINSSYRATNHHIAISV